MLKQNIKPFFGLHMGGGGGGKNPGNPTNPPTETKPPTRSLLP